MLVNGAQRLVVPRHEQAHGATHAPHHDAFAHQLINLVKMLPQYRRHSVIIVLM